MCSFMQKPRGLEAAGFRGGMGCWGYFLLLLASS